MKLDDITLVLGIDSQHLEELRWTWPTWMRFKPELLQMPAVVFYDPIEIEDPQTQAHFLLRHPRLRFVPWDWSLGRDQREKMITAWMHIPAREVQTPWYLKLDTDAMATGHGEWIKEEWFAPGPAGALPQFIASPGSGIKPGHVIRLLDDWADSIPALAAFPRLDLAYPTAENRFNHPKVISWLFFGRTEWTRKLAGFLGPTGKMPRACDDTFQSFCAKRMDQWFVRERMKNYHWLHKRFYDIQIVVRKLGIKPIPLRPKGRAGSPLHIPAVKEPSGIETPVPSSPCSNMRIP